MTLAKPDLTLSCPKLTAQLITSVVFDCAVTEEFSTISFV